jgi:hypothetical protein
MNRHDDLLEKAGGLLGDHADRIEHDPSREVRARAVSAMEAALRAKSKRRRLLTHVTRFSIAAVTILGVLGGYRAYQSLRTRGTANASEPKEVVATGRIITGVASAWHNGQPVPFEGRLSTGDRVTTAPDAHAEIALTTGTSVVLGPSADTTFTGANKLQSFSLAAGSVTARVAKLHEGDRFLVRTADAEVEVRGTVFKVSLVEPDRACGNGTPTRVTVTEGVVVVRNNGLETKVPAGSVWPAGCVEKQAVVAPPPAPVAPVVTAAPPPAVSAPAVDGLAAKNDLFASALAAKRRGELQVALNGFETYLSKYPGGELAESAAAQRMSILGKIDPARAAVAAKEYLAKWPKGFAREEAEALANK